MNANLSHSPTEAHGRNRTLMDEDGHEFSLHCGRCGREMVVLDSTPNVFRCFRCKRSCVRQDLPRAVSGAEAVSPVGRRAKLDEGAALDSAGAERSCGEGADGLADTELAA